MRRRRPPERRPSQSVRWVLVRSWVSRNRDSGRDLPLQLIELSWRGGVDKESDCPVIRAFQLDQLAAAVLEHQDGSQRGGVAGPPWLDLRPDPAFTDPVWPHPWPA